MKKLLTTPYPAHVHLTGETARGTLWCPLPDGDEVLACAAERFARSGELPVKFAREYAGGEHRDCFYDPEGYVLEITPAGARISASASAGALYGAMTLSHIARQYGECLPCGLIAGFLTGGSSGAGIGILTVF